MPQMVEKLGLTPDQQKKMDDVFQQNRVKLIDLTASLEKEEVTLEPLVAADQPDADKIRAQINRVADARSELEKANSNLLLGIRLLLTPEQWRTLHAEARKLRPRKVVREYLPPEPAIKKNR
jgi:Spy/CpxP family protein refolding chaperone